MKNGLRVALLQLLPGATLEENQRIGTEACRQAKASGADIALFPEMWSTGYQIPTQAEALRAAAIPADGAFARHFAALAAELDMAIGLTLLEAYAPSPRNTLVLFDRFGREVLRYAKVHTCDFSAHERVLTPGEDFHVAALDTRCGPVKVGVMICYDREQPESARILMLKGAEIILVPNACTIELNRMAQLRTRAYENMVGIAMTNYPAGHPDCNGHSAAFDGMADFPGEDGPHDSLVIEAGQRPGIYLADFPLAELRAYRQRGIHGNAYRRPQAYDLLVSEAVEEPFLRPDARR